MIGPVGNRLLAVMAIDVTYSSDVNALVVHGCTHVAAPLAAAADQADDDPVAGGDGFLFIFRGTDLVLEDFAGRPNGQAGGGQPGQ